MNNPILDKIIESRNGHYCHCLEVEYSYELEDIVEGLISEFGDKYSAQEYIEFFQSMEIYYLGEDKEEENKVYDFSFREYIGETI
jgi:hypothetical protein